MKKIVFSLCILAFSFTLFFNFQVSSIDGGTDITLSNVGKVAFATSECEEGGGWDDQIKYGFTCGNGCSGVACDPEPNYCCTISW